MQPSHNSGPYTHSARGGNTGHTEHRYSRDRTKRMRMRAPTTITRRARRIERSHERPVRVHTQLISWPNTYTRFRPLEPLSQAERRQWYMKLIMDPLDRYAAILGNYHLRKLKYNKN